MQFLTSMPTISNHACWRAEERFGISQHGFTEWVKATYGHWMPVNAEFLRNHNISCSAADSWFFVTPWTSLIGMAIIMSNDRCIRTVMDFSTESRFDLMVRVGGKSSIPTPVEPPSVVVDAPQAPKPIVPLMSKDFVVEQLADDTNVYQQCLKRMVQDGELGADSIFRKALKASFDPDDMDWIHAYAKGDLRLSELREILNTKKTYRRMAYEALVVNKVPV